MDCYADFISEKRFLLQNPGYPGKYDTAGTCIYLVKRMDEGVCQIRYMQLTITIIIITICITITITITITTINLCYRTTPPRLRTTTKWRRGRTTSPLRTPPSFRLSFVLRFVSIFVPIFVLVF